MFKTGKPVKGKDFIDRKKHLPIFEEYLNNEQDIMIKAPRRFGKTSLIKQVFEHEKKYPFIYVDLRKTTNLKNLANQIIDKAYLFAGIENFFNQFKKSTVGLLKSIQKIKVEHIGEVTLEFLEKHEDLNEVEYFLHSLDVVEKIAQKQDIKIKFIFDEFQDILRIADSFILENLRATIQHHNNVTYVFLGSIETIMTKIFEDKGSPFFHFVKVMRLGGLDIDELYDYAKEVFDEMGILYDENLFLLLNFLEGHPDYSAQILQTLYIKSKLGEIVNIDKNICIEVLRDSIEENRAYLDELIIKAKQKKHHYEVLHAIANKSATDLDYKNLYRVNASLEEMGLTKKIDRGEYKINDVYLNIFLQQNSDYEMSLLELRGILSHKKN